MQNEKPEMLSAEEAAEYLGVHKATVWKWCRQGKLPHYRYPGNSIRLDKDELRQWKNGRWRAPQSPRHWPKPATDIDARAAVSGKKRKRKKGKG